VEGLLSRWTDSTKDKKILFISFGVLDVNRLLNCKDVDTNECRSGNDDYNYLSHSSDYCQSKTRL